MGLLKNLRDRRRQSEPPSVPAAVASGAATSPGDVPPAPRNRAERRFHERRIPKLAGRIEMRHTTKRQHNHRTARWQVRMLRYLGNHWSVKPGRVAK